MKYVTGSKYFIVWLNHLVGNVLVAAHDPNIFFWLVNVKNHTRPRATRTSYTAPAKYGRWISRRMYIRKEKKKLLKEQGFETWWRLPLSNPTQSIPYPRAPTPLLSFFSSIEQPESPVLDWWNATIQAFWLWNPWNSLVFWFKHRREGTNKIFCVTFLVFLSGHLPLVYSICQRPYQLDQVRSLASR